MQSTLGHWLKQGQALQQRPYRDTRTLKSSLSLLSQAALQFHYIIVHVCGRLEKVGLMKTKEFSTDLNLTGERAKARLAELTSDGISEVDVSNLELNDWRGLARTISKLTEVRKGQGVGTRITATQLEVILKAFLDLMIKLAKRFDKVESLMTTYEKERLSEELRQLENEELSRLRVRARGA